MTDEKQNNQKPWYKSLYVWGVIVYLLCIFSYTVAFMVQGGKNYLLSSNELGDFLAGVFAPLAFLYLFLGYKQQEKSIEKTNENIAIQLDQQNRMLLLQEQERIQQEHATQPIFDLEILAKKYPKLVYAAGIFVPEPDSDGIKFEINIENKGERISQINISLIGDIEHFLLIENSVDTNHIIRTGTILSKEQVESFNGRNIRFILHIEYRTALGFKYFRNFNIEHSLKFNNLSYDYDADYVKIN